MLIVYRHSSLQQRLVLIAASILLGLIASVGLCVVGYIKYRNYVLSPHWPTRQSLRGGETTDGRGTWFISHDWSFDRLEEYWHSDQFAQSAKSSLSFPYWYYTETYPQPSAGGSRYTLAVGTPLRCSRAVVEVLPWNTPLLSVIVREGNDPYAHPMPWMKNNPAIHSDADIAPTHVLVLPFIVNAVVWSIVAYVILCLFLFIRRLHLKNR